MWLISEDRLSAVDTINGGVFKIGKRSSTEKWELSYGPVIVGKFAAVSDAIGVMVEMALLSGEIVALKKGEGMTSWRRIDGRNTENIKHAVKELMS